MTAAVCQHWGQEWKDFTCVGTQLRPTGELHIEDGPEFDLFLCGTVFLDIIFTGMEAMPTSGTEVWAEGMGSSPGGTANLAIAASRLGLRTSLAAAFGDDDYADLTVGEMSIDRIARVLSPPPLPTKKTES